MKAKKTTKAIKRWWFLFIYCLFFNYLSIPITNQSAGFQWELK